MEQTLLSNDEINATNNMFTGNTIGILDEYIADVLCPDTEKEFL